MPRSFPLLLFLLITISAAHAQSDTIIPNPNAVKLRRIWKIEGGAGANLGGGSGSIGDVNGDSLGDFAVWSGRPLQWAVYYAKIGGPSTTPTWKFADTAAADIGHPVVGDFWGTGHRAVGFLRARLEGPTSTSHYWLYIFRTDSNRLDTTASMIWDSQAISDPVTILFPKEIIGADLDGDGDDELIVATTSVRRGSEASMHAETWIYEGGPGFQIDTPTVMLRDPLENNGGSHGYTFVTDFDKDGHVDLIRGEHYNPSQQLKYSFYWGNGRLPQPGRLPDRTVNIRGVFPAMADVDGDGAGDIMARGISIWRSNSGKDARTRLFDSADVDVVLNRGVGYTQQAFRLGHLNSARYEMIARLQGSSEGAMLAGFSGGALGPNQTWDAYYSQSSDGLNGSPFGLSTPIGDVDGDGWEDVLVSNWSYPDNITSRGIAMILAGGSYIPTDDPSVSVREISVAGVERAISIWPNPATSELNIAWRGDLSPMPHRFEIYDLLGRHVAGGVIEDGSAALWRCDGVASGSYRLCIFDLDGAIIASVSCIKQ